jgi:hypothetical protein
MANRINHNPDHECPLCGTYLPSLGHLLSERNGIKARFDCSEASWQELFKVEAAIRAAGGMHLIGTTYNED